MPDRERSANFAEDDEARALFFASLVATAADRLTRLYYLHLYWSLEGVVVRGATRVRKDVYPPVAV